MIPDNMRGKFIHDHLTLIYQRLSELEAATFGSRGIYPQMSVGTGLGEPKWNPTNGKYFPPGDDSDR